MNNRPTCVSWVLLAVYAVLLGIGGVGVWLSVTNFGEEEPLPPTPPPKLENTSITTTTTTTPDRYGNNYYNSRNEDKIPEEYKEYIYASLSYSKPTSEARIYVLVPCIVTVVVAAMVLVAGLWSRQFFSSTFSLYNSLALWILTLTWIIVYQNVVAWNSHMSLNDVWWVIAIQVILMLLLSVQILLSLWELRRQKAGWPTLNISNVFTIEALLVTARLTLTVYTMIFLSNSQMFQGFQGLQDSRYKNFQNPGTRFPLVLTFVCCSAACYNVVATIETTLSMLLGKLHNCMTTITSLVSALCCATVAVLNSPVIVKTVITPNYINTETMYFSIGLSVVTFLHVVACVCFPISSRSPPEILKKIMIELVSAMYSLGNGIASQQLWHTVLLQKKEKCYFFFNLISSIFSVLSMIVIAVVWTSPMYRAWGSVLVLCANFATLVRTLPPVVMELTYKQAENTPVIQKLIGMVLESCTLLVGVIAIFANCYRGGEIFSGVANLLFLAFQIFIIVQLVKGKFRAAESEEVEHLSRNDDEQTPNDLLA